MCAYVLHLCVVCPWSCRSDLLVGPERGLTSSIPLSAYIFTVYSSACQSFIRGVMIFQVVETQMTYTLCGAPECLTTRMTYLTYSVIVS